MQPTLQGIPPPCIFDYEPFPCRLTLKLVDVSPLALGQRASLLGQTALTSSPSSWATPRRSCNAVPTVLCPPFKTIHPLSRNHPQHSSASVTNLTAAHLTPCLTDFPTKLWGLRGQGLLLCFKHPWARHTYCNKGMLACFRRGWSFSILWRSREGALQQRHTPEFLFSRINSPLVTALSALLGWAPRSLI